TCCRFSPRKWISSLAWRNAAIPFRLNFSASCTLIIHPQHACILQAHLVLETDPCFRLILYWKRLESSLPCPRAPHPLHHIVDYRANTLRWLHRVSCQPCVKSSSAN